MDWKTKVVVGRESIVATLRYRLHSSLQMPAPAHQQLGLHSDSGDVSTGDCLYNYSVCHACQGWNFKLFRSFTVLSWNWNNQPFLCPGDYFPLQLVCNDTRVDCGVTHSCHGTDWFWVDIKIWIIESESLQPDKTRWITIFREIIHFDASVTMKTRLNHQNLVFSF